MRKANDVVRVKKVYSVNDEKYEEIVLMNFNEYADAKKYKVYGSDLFEYPFKWYDVSRFIKIRNYRKRLLKNSLPAQNSPQNAHIKTSSTRENIGLLMSIIDFIVKYWKQISVFVAAALYYIIH